MFKKLIALIKSWFCKPPVVFNPLKNGYKLIKQYDFRVSLINWNQWTWLYPGGQDHKDVTYWVKECVVDSPNGLRLIAKQGQGVNNCGQICSNDDILYGYFSITAKIPPKGILYFPAIWMYNRLGWQPEIDIMEAASETSKQICFTHHWVGNNGQDVAEGFTKSFAYDLSLAFHEYSVEWTPTKLTWFVDGIQCFTTTNNIPQIAQFLICCVQSGGIEGGCKHLYTANEVPAEMIVRKIEIYQK